MAEDTTRLWVQIAFPVSFLWPPVSRGMPETGGRKPMRLPSGPIFSFLLLAFAGLRYPSAENGLDGRKRVCRDVVDVDCNLPCLDGNRSDGWSWTGSAPLMRISLAALFHLVLPPRASFTVPNRFTSDIRTASPTPMLSFVMALDTNSFPSYLLTDSKSMREMRPSWLPNSLRGHLLPLLAEAYHVVDQVPHPGLCEHGICDAFDGHVAQDVYRPGRRVRAEHVERCERNLLR